MTTKTCLKCGGEFPLENFSVDKRKHDGRFHQCKKCKKRYDACRTYNITEEQYDQWNSAGCAVCGTLDNLCVDHCHQTGRARGMLCYKHNTLLAALEAFQADPKTLDKLLRYQHDN